jgi:DNA-binding NtrC family response regulator
MHQGDDMSLEHNQHLQQECGDDEPSVAPRLDEEIDCAARSHVPVLISGDPEEGREIACAIDRRSTAPNGTVEVVDCRESGALKKLMTYRADRAAHADRASILLLQEVHALSPNEQAQFDRGLAEMRASRRAGAVRIIASSSEPLFDRVREGSFDERLFYRLNVIHMIVA